MDPLDKDLAAYTVRNADKQLLEHIVAAGIAQGRPQPRHAFAQAATFAAIAVTGFWLGTTPPAATSASSQTTFMDNVILGPDSLAEMPM